MHTNIYLQTLVSIQPRTSPPKNCKILLIFPILLTLTPNPRQRNTFRPAQAAQGPPRGGGGDARGGEAHPRGDVRAHGRGEGLPASPRCPRLPTIRSGLCLV